jgi:hypothetical protein
LRCGEYLLLGAMAQTLLRVFEKDQSSRVPFCRRGGYTPGMQGDTQTGGRRAAELVAGGYLPSALIVVGGFGVYYFLFQVLVDPLNPAGPLPEVGPVFLWQGNSPAPPSAILASDFNARYTFAVPSVLMTLSFIAAVIVAFRFVLPQFGRVAMALGLLSLPAGAGIGWYEQYANLLRTIVADCTPGLEATSCPLDQAALRAPSELMFGADTLAQVRFLANLNSMVSVAAIGLIGVCCIFIARTVPASRLDTGYLARRRAGLDAMLTVVGPILVFSVATTHGFYHFSSALMHPPAADAYRLLASAGTTYWGAVYTTVLLVIALPAAVSVTWDGRRAAAAALPDGNFTERLEWRKQEGVELSIRDRLRLAVASFAPVLTAPFLDLLRNSLGV